MTTTAPRTQFEKFRARALDDPETLAAYEDAKSRNRLVDALVRMRRRVGLTQTQVARCMGVKQPSVSGFETEGSDPRLSTLLRYARAVDAVFVWDVKPKLDVIQPDAPYHQRDCHVALAVSHAEPSARARAWDPRPAYQEQRRLHAVA